MVVLEQYWDCYNLCKHKHLATTTESPWGKPWRFSTSLEHPYLQSLCISICAASSRKGNQSSSYQHYGCVEIHCINFVMVLRDPVSETGCLVVWNEEILHLSCFSSIVMPSGARVKLHFKIFRISPPNSSNYMSESFWSY